MKILNKLNINSHANLKIKNLILITLFLSSILLTTLFTVPVQACRNVGTYEEDYQTPKTTFMLGDVVYGKGGDDYESDFRLRIRDPSGEEMYKSDPVKGTEVTCAWRIYDDATPGQWSIQLGEYYNNDWHWVKTSYFDVLATPEYTLSIHINSLGTVSKNPDQTTYVDGTVVQLTANPDSCWAFDYWSDDLSGYNNPETIVMDGNKIVTAHFSEAYYLLTINVDGSGSISIDPLQELYDCGTLVDLTANADPGWSFNYWSGDLSGSNDSETINMTSDKNIYAHFYKESSNGGNGGDPNGGGPRGGGGSTGSKPISKNIPPIADPSAGDTYLGSVNSDIIFNGSFSYDPDGSIVSWKWDFGDGNSSEGEMVSHKYSTAGMYNVILTVTDDKGATNDSEISILVIQPNNPPSNPDINGPSRGIKDIDYAFTVVSTDDDDDSIKYIIDWGDGGIDESEFLPNGTIFAISHIWKSAGSYTIKVTADDNQTISSSELIIIIDEPVPEEENFTLIFLALLAIILIILFAYLSKRKKDKKNK